MPLTDYLVLPQTELERLDALKKRHKQLFTDPQNARPLIFVNVKDDEIPNPALEAQLSGDPILSMLKTQLDAVAKLVKTQDDRLPHLRVNFGTAQVPHAFGCEVTEIDKQYGYACKTHILHDLKDVDHLQMPSLDAGFYGEIKKYTDIFKKYLPKGVEIQHPDIQSTFNSAYLIRGNDIFLDFYDDPERLCKLLDLVTDYMIKLVPYLKDMISNDKEWFYDYNVLWPGAIRISNCSIHMLPPEFYREYVKPRDQRFLKAFGGGRIHYCGSSGEVMKDFLTIDCSSGTDYDDKYHDLWDLCEMADRNKVIFCTTYGDPSYKPIQERLLKGEWPEKRNIVFNTYADSYEEGYEIYNRLLDSMPKHWNL